MRIYVLVVRVVSHCGILAVFLLFLHLATVLHPKIHITNSSLSDTIPGSPGKQCAWNVYHVDAVNPDDSDLGLIVRKIFGKGARRRRSSGCML
jgi:hypothetical protein